MRIWSGGGHRPAGRADRVGRSRRLAVRLPQRLRRDARAEHPGGLPGVTSSSSTSHHFGERVAEVPCRQTIPKTVKARTADGGLVTQPMVDSQPKSSGGSYEGTRDPEFNRLGAMLEQQGLVSRSFVGNAAVRRFAMRDPFDHVEVEADGDFNLFRTAEGPA